MNVVYAPTPWSSTPRNVTVFLAGSIEQGTADDWQTKIVRHIEWQTNSSLDAPVCYDPVLFLNPRRPEWDDTWRQSIDEPKFVEQVMWELDGLERADMVAMWFEPDTKSPITLLELGLLARFGGEVIVGCPEGFWRRGNVEVVCARYGPKLVPTWGKFVWEVGHSIRRRLAAIPP